jgi:hypothetical protein
VTRHVPGRRPGHTRRRRRMSGRRRASRREGSFALDLIEAVRPDVETFVLDLISKHSLRPGGADTLSPPAACQPAGRGVVLPGLGGPGRRFPPCALRGLHRRRPRQTPELLGRRGRAIAAARAKEKALGVS